GYSLNETIKGVINGTTVADFYAKITKADELQTLKVISAFSGAELDEADRINNGDTLVVLSADGKHTSKYILRGTFEVLSVGTMLTSTIYTIYVTGSTGIITGFPKYTPLKTVLEGVVIPSGATLTMVDQNDGYKTLIKLNYDTVYVDVLATLAIYFEVIAENGRDKVLYQLRPTSISVDAYATSDLYSINQISSFLYPLIQGTSVNGLFSNLTPAPGASMKVYDKEGFVRSTGIICKDDKLVVTSLDGTIRKAYYFKTPGFEGGPYLAFILSDDYQIDQVLRSIGGVSEG
ncbi:MAG TPA: hypothetical protein DCL77_14060, partial [Prolixibacteraceae bacterium]|nr:hypothetical protein [Prolixibacteraceae bacterium]